MDMLKLIQQMTDIENEEKRKNLNESALDECGESGMMPQAENAGNPVTMSVTLNASGKDHVTDLMDMLKAAGLEDAKPVGPEMMPMRQDMDRLGDIMRKSEMGEEDLEEYDNEPEEAYMDQPKGGGINREKDMYPDADEGDNAMAVTEKRKEADPEVVAKVQELSKIKNLDVLKKEVYDLVKSTKMNQAKKMQLMRNTESSRTVANLYGLIWNTFILGVEGKYAPGSSWSKRFEDSEDEMRESIKSQLLKSLEEKKSKPDFLDVDKDGDKKEPMKKALKDKGGKAKKGKVPPQFQKKK